MRRTALLSAALLGWLLCLPPSSVARPRAAVSTKAMTPPPGSPVRAAIMDALRAQVKALLGSAYPWSGAEFVVNSVKVHGDWAYASVRPRAKSGPGEYEPLNELLRRAAGRWRVVDGPDFEMGSEQGLSDAQIMGRFRRRHPKAPADLF